MTHLLDVISEHIYTNYLNYLGVIGSFCLAIGFSKEVIFYIAISAWVAILLTPYSNILAVICVIIGYVLAGRKHGFDMVHAWPRKPGY